MIGAKGIRHILKELHVALFDDSHCPFLVFGFPHGVLDFKAWIKESACTRVPVRSSVAASCPLTLQTEPASVLLIGSGLLVLLRVRRFKRAR